jgi:sugar phosphate permease
MIIPNNEQKNIKLDTIGTNTNENAIGDDSNDKKLCLKLDLHLLPTIILLYLLNFLDRINIGQAKIIGLADSLKLTSAQYNACVSVVFVTYVIFEIPSNLVLKKLRPSRWLPVLMVIWGIIMTLTGLVNSYGSLIACRLLLGAAESGVFPGKSIFSTQTKIFRLSCFICD